MTTTAAAHAVAQFFGELSGTQQTVKEDQYFQNTHELPDAYIGRNKFLMSTLDYLITKEGRDFLTQVILPFEHTENTNVAWEIFHFDRSIADIEPEQGVPRYVTMKQDVHSDRLVRRGLAFVIEHGFYTTDVGRRHYMMNIQQIVDAVSETTALQALHALIEAEDFYSVTDSAPGSILAHVTEQMRRFAVIQRGNAGMHLLDSDLKDNMLRYNVRPDAYIMPPRATSYINMRDPYMTEYSRGGRGVEALEGPDQQLTFRGTRVYEARYFETDYVADPFDPLSQVITYAEYYPCDAAGRVHIYDMERDEFFNASHGAPGGPGVAVAIEPEGGGGGGSMGGRGGILGGLFGGGSAAEAGSSEYEEALEARSRRASAARAERGSGVTVNVDVGGASISKPTIGGDVNDQRALFKDSLKFTRWSGPAETRVTDMSSFKEHYLSTLPVAHQRAVLEHMATLEGGSIVRPKYVKDFVKTLK